MARPRKKRKYTKKAAFWGKPVGRVNKKSAPVRAGRINLASKDPWTMSDYMHANKVVYATRAEAFAASKSGPKAYAPYVCSQCGEWHVGIQ